MISSTVVFFISVALQIILLALSDYLIWYNEYYDIHMLIVIALLYMASFVTMLYFMYHRNH